MFRRFTLNINIAATFPATQHTRPTIKKYVKETNIKHAAFTRVKYVKHTHTHIYIVKNSEI